jgi:uncharacterized protein (DUF305 family)
MEPQPMNETRFTYELTSILAASLAFSACSSIDSVSAQLTTNRFHRNRLTQRQALASHMVMHHQQAIEMADMSLEKDDVDASVTALAERAKAAQEPEIDTMNEWLDSGGESTDLSKTTIWSPCPDR